MKNNDAKLLNLPTTSLRERVDDIHTRVLRTKPQNINDAYALEVARGADRVICEQGVKFLPRSLTELISLSLRDEGNALIDETRQFNNRYVGYTIKTMEAEVVGDLEVIELKERLLDWAQRVAKAVLFRVRRQIASEPIKTYLKLYESFIHEVDTTIAHGLDNMYSLVWEPTMEALPYWMIDAIFVKSGLVSGHFDNNLQDRQFIQGGTLKGSDRELFAINQHLSLYAYAPTIYTTEVVLNPLLQHLKADGFLPAPEEMDRQKGVFLADMLEAFPYLLSSTRIGKNLFQVLGAGTVATFDYTANNGFGRFFLSDTPERFAREIERGKSLGVLEVQFDGKISYYPFPWMTIESVFGKDDTLVLSYWLLKQAHERVVASYLKISSDHLSRKPRGTSPEPVKEAEIYPYSEYTAWIREAQDEDSLPDIENSEVTVGWPSIQIPQMRRTRLFKILGNCGVSVEQGKGSEFKLLKPNAHPFRLGNHYGPNPTVPSFMVANILKRLQISHDDWGRAIASVARDCA